MGRGGGDCKQTQKESPGDVKRRGGETGSAMKTVDLTLDAVCEGGQSGWWGSRRTLGGYTGGNFWQRDML